MYCTVHRILILQTKDSINGMLKRKEFDRHCAVSYGTVRYRTVPYCIFYKEKLNIDDPGRCSVGPKSWVVVGRGCYATISDSTVEYRYGTSTGTVRCGIELSIILRVIPNKCTISKYVRP